MKTQEYPIVMMDVHNTSHPAATQPLHASAMLKRFSSILGEHLLWVDGSRIFDIPDDVAHWLDEALAQPTISPELQQFLTQQTQTLGEAIGQQPAIAKNVRAISLNVAQSCNLACRYCYADEGRFGGSGKQMTETVARQTVDHLLAQANRGDSVVIGFMGGEPLLNRKLIHKLTHYAQQQAKARNIRCNFSITTNATLLNEADAKLFSDYGFQVTVSLDGPPEINDHLRPAVKDKGSYTSALQGIQWLRKHKPAHLSGRITVTPQTPELLPILKHMLGLGFDDVGFSPVLSSPDPHYAFNSDDFDHFLQQMRECGVYSLAQLKQGKRFPFSNFETALHELHRGSHRPYPCGAGAGYLSVNAEGVYYACHRLIDKPHWKMGDIKTGFDNDARQILLDEKFVDHHTQCRNCWARYLCGGGCYHEVEQRGRIACDYIRGWLNFCLGAYAELSGTHPEYFRFPEQFLATHISQPNRTEALNS